MTTLALNPNGLVLDPPSAVAVAHCLIARLGDVLTTISNSLGVQG